MLKNYFTIAWRNIVRSGAHAFINVSGLTTGIAVTILIGLWIFDELNFNRSFKNYHRLGQLYHEVTFGEETMTIADVPAPIGGYLKDHYADFEEVAITSWPREHIIAHEETKLSETALLVEPQFVNMFSVRLLQGANTLSADIRTVLISKTLAAALLGDQPIGKMIRFDNRDLLMVAGVYEDFPQNSQFAEVKILVPIAYHFAINESHKKQMHSWEGYHFQCFVLMKDDALFHQVEEKIKNALYKNASNDGKALKPKGILFPMEKWHLYAGFDGVNSGSQIRFVWMFGIVGGFVLLLACINFTNLSTAQSERRSKEVGIRKVMGSGQKQLALQFLIESFVMVTIGFLLALIVAGVSLPWFNELSGKKMVIPWTSSVFILVALVFIIITTILAGSYPALYLSSFNPVKILKGKMFKTGRSGIVPRQVFVIFQFTASIVLIIGTIVVFLQIGHAKDRPVGFDREGIIHVAIRTESLAKANYNSLRHELLSTQVVENMAISDFPITGSMSANASLTWEGKDPALRPLVAMNSCSHDFPKTNGFEFIEGRDFSREYSTDSAAVIVNEMAAKLISEENVIGKKLSFSYGKEREVIGVIKDQVRWTPFADQSPHLYYISYSAAGYLTIRLTPNANVHDALQKVGAVLKKFDPGAPFEYTFQDDDYARLFKSEERIGILASAFSALAIFISCTGIFGLAAFSASQRTRELGIRKVLGASVFNLWGMLSIEFVRLVIVSILIGAPLAYYCTTQWLLQYEYRVQIPWLVYVLTGMTAMAITLLTVSYHALKAALMNPVRSLRAE